LLSLHTGLRAGEIFSLRKSHFDEKHKVLYVFDTKSNNRNIPLNSAALDVLQRRSAEKDYIFKEHGQPIKYVSRIFKNAVSACSLNVQTQDRRQRVVFHTLRHTFASWLVQKGTPLMVVSQLLGHKTLQMTMRYAHLAPSQGAQAVQELEQFADYVNVNPPGDLDDMEKK
jgi:integrase